MRITHLECSVCCVRCDARLRSEEEVITVWHIAILGSRLLAITSCGLLSSVLVVGGGSYSKVEEVDSAVGLVVEILRIV